MSSSSSAAGVKVAMWCARRRSTRGGTAASSPPRGVAGLGQRGVAEDIANSALGYGLQGRHARAKMMRLGMLQTRR
jgi:hypothetical protein